MACTPAKEASVMHNAQKQFKPCNPGGRSALINISGEAETNIANGHKSLVHL
jgi:hypothetical protein